MKWERKIANLRFHEMNGSDFTHINPMAQKKLSSYNINPMAIFLFSFLTFDHLYSYIAKKIKVLFHIRVLKESFTEYIYDCYNFNFTIIIL